VSTSTCPWSIHHSESLFSSCLKTERLSAPCSSGVLCQNVGSPGSPAQDTLVSGQRQLQLCLMEEKAVIFLSPCLKATQTQGKMYHQLSSPRIHRDVLAQGAELCLLTAPLLEGQLEQRLPGVGGSRWAVGRAGHSPLCACCSCLALGLRAQGARSLGLGSPCWRGCCVLSWEPLPPGCLSLPGRAEGTAHR